MQHFISIADTTPEQVQHVFDVALRLRDERRAGKPHDPILKHQTLAMLFQKPSLRTRVSFEQAMLELGGHAIVLGQSEVGLGVRESVADVVRVLNGMVHGIMARVFEHDSLVEMARHSDVPVINALSDMSHPCQALADVMTLLDEFGRDLTGRTVAFIGDGNNVARSIATLCGRVGMNFILASPPGYELEQAFADRIMSQVPAMNFELTNDPLQAVHDADAIYTDTWVSMGQESEKAKRQAAFSAYQVNAKLLKAAPSHAVVLHCLPAHRGVEITDEVMDGPRSRIIPQAHNRLHAQKGLLAVLMGGA
ncbi:MAG: ornithine carbamoyltransferase [Phycisphaeraceae bacterium]